MGRCAGVPAGLYGLSPLGLGGTRESVTVDEYRTVMRAHMKAAFDDPWVCREAANPHTPRG